MLTINAYSVYCTVGKLREYFANLRGVADPNFICVTMRNENLEAFYIIRASFWVLVVV